MLKPSIDTKSGPVFIIGTERSGSNLLRLILDAHSRIAIPHPPHIVFHLASIEHCFGDLAQDENLRALIAAVLRLLDSHISPWPIRPSPEALLKDAEPRNLLGVQAALYRAYADHVGKPRWGCKSTFLIDHGERVMATYPDARFVWLIRDPRDVACSSRRSVFNPFHPYFTAALWREQQSRGLALEQAYPGSVHRVYYEALLAEPGKTVESLCAFIGERPEAQMLRFFETGEAKRLAGLAKDWSNAGSPILSDNHGKWRAELTRKELVLVEAASSPVMYELGYVPETQAAERSSTRPSIPWLRCLDLAIRLRVEVTSMFRNKNHWLRWRRARTVRSIHAEVRRRRVA